jgi:hypothetical protein
MVKELWEKTSSKPGELHTTVPDVLSLAIRCKIIFQHD